MVASIARHALPPRSVAGGLESMPVATCAMTPRRAPTSSTMATRIAATRVPLAARRSGELRPCKLAPSSGAKRSTRSPAHRPCASCRPMRNRQTVPISAVRCQASESMNTIARRAESNATPCTFNLAMSARASTLGSRIFRPSLLGQRIETTNCGQRIGQTLASRHTGGFQ